MNDKDFVELCGHVTLQEITAIKNGANISANDDTVLIITCSEDNSTVKPKKDRFPEIGIFYSIDGELITSDEFKRAVNVVTKTIEQFEGVAF
jgi:hypothetical protein